MDSLEEMHYFATPVYSVKKTEFLEVVRSVSDRYMAEAIKKQQAEERGLLMTANYMLEPELSEFSQYVSQTAWNILAAQGFAMESLVTYFTEMWTQEHRSMSSMETHVHGHGSQITCFYALDAKPNGCKLVIHDPRPGKVILNLPESNGSAITLASHQIVFTLQPGMLVFFNSWLPHSLSKNLGDPVQYVHMNLSVAPIPVDPKVEVV